MNTIHADVLEMFSGSCQITGYAPVLLLGSGGSLSDLGVDVGAIIDQGA